MTIKLVGNWRDGKAFDVHMLSSVYLGPNEFGHAKFDNTRSEMGDLVYKLKYSQDKSVLPAIIALLDKITGIEEFACIIPIPPTNKARTFQPVTEIALALGKHRGVKVLTDFLANATDGKQLKNVDDVSEREKLVKESLCIEGKQSIAGCHVLLVDDLYDSGATLRAATDLLIQQGKAASVCVLTMTKTGKH
jgi:competence protein ComFC